MTEPTTDGPGIREYFLEHKRGCLTAILVVLIILIVLLFTKCDSCSGRLSSIKNHMPFIGESETTQVSEPDVADGCTYCRDDEEFRRQVVQLVTSDQEIAIWLKKLICETDCSPPPANTEEEQSNRSPGRSCSDLGPGWSCVDTRKYACVETRRGYCSGPSYIRCGRQCNERSRSASPPAARWEYHDFTCVGTDCDALYSDVLTNPNATIVDEHNRQVATTGSGPERHFAPTRRVRVRVPAGTRVNHANLRSANGQWSVSTDGARVEGNSEVSDPNFGVRHNNRPLGTTDSRKMQGDWTYDVQAPEPTQANPPTSDGTGTFEVN